MTSRRLPKSVGLAAALAAWWLAAPEVGAHPMGNFAICHYARIRADRDALRVRFVLDFAEIPAVGEKRLLDRDGDGAVSPAEEEAYLAAKASEVLPALTLAVNGVRLPLRRDGGGTKLSPGAGGLETLRITFDLSAPWPAGEPSGAVAYRDDTFAARAGWKEVIAVAGAGTALEGSSVPAADRSNELSDYPAEVIPPQVTAARFIARPGPSAGGGAEPARPPAAGSATTPRDAFTQAVAAADLGAAVVLTGLAIAFGFGALHALSPGHGKAMVAAYLVGARGTMAHAVLLGAVVTATHTAGVFALGLVTLFASEYVLPEVLYPVLGAFSGLTVCAVGVWLLYRRVRRLLRGPQAPRPAAAHGHHLPEGPVTLRALVAMGVSGGIIPCPSALVVLLAAVALHRVAYGLMLIGTFSLGLGTVLVAIGLLVVRARGWIEGVRVSGALLRRIPVASAAVITLIGLALVARALGQGLGW